MFFEGSEKKLEVLTNSSAPSLRRMGKAYWEELVYLCGATILSQVSNDYCDAFLLSESSLFVWDHRFVMITCGNTSLVNSLLAFVEKFSLGQIGSIIFQRKNEYQERLQQSDFHEDVERIKKLIPGKGVRFGHLDGHHTYLFHLDSGTCNNLVGLEEDVTTELLMYHISGKTAKLLMAKDQSKSGIRAILGLDHVLKDFVVDDYLFTPFGYSLNAIKENKYITIHITPQECSSYVSFETNCELQLQYPALIDNILETFMPESFDLVSFNREISPQLTKHQGICLKKYQE